MEYTGLFFVSLLCPCFSCAATLWNKSRARIWPLIIWFDHNACQEDGNKILLCLLVTDWLVDGMTDYVTDWMVDWMSNLEYQDTDWLNNWLRGTQRWFPPKCIENTFWAIQSTFRSLEMHAKWRYKICICSVILGQLESLRNYKGLHIIFPKILDVILPFTKVRIFLIPLSIAFLIRKF